jgi:hypothetical protein
LDVTIWSLKSPLVKRTSCSKKFRSSPQKDFCNNIEREAHIVIIRFATGRCRQSGRWAYFDTALADRHGKRAATPSERAGYEAVTDFDKVIAMFVRTGVWSRYAGPEPGMLGCRAPRELLAKHGIDAVTRQKMRKGGQAYGCSVGERL